MPQDQPQPETFHFRGIHPRLCFGTASDRYAGWMGQVYSPTRYAGRLSTRSHKVGGKTFQEQVLPVDSVSEYFDHFGVLEIDYTFYGLLLTTEGKPTATHTVLRSYCEHLPPWGRVLLKVPQTVFAQKIREADHFVPNPHYFDSRLFTEAFHGPAVDLLGEGLAGFVFEQEYQRKAERASVESFAEALDRFFESIPRDPRYHVELRTESYLSPPVFRVFERHGIGQVFSRWTWLPPLPKQLARAGGRFFNHSRQCVVRVMTPIGMRYEEAYARAYPFDRMVDELFQPALVEEAVGVAQAGIDQGMTVHIVINNRAGGNAPLIARQVAARFLADPRRQQSPET